MCDRCGVLAAENAQLKDELAEWRRQAEDHGKLSDDQEVDVRWRRSLRARPGVARLARLMVRRAGQIVTPDAVVRAVSPDPDSIADSSRTSGVAICQLRAALRSRGLDGSIDTIWGVGWRMPRPSAARLDQFVLEASA